MIGKILVLIGGTLSLLLYRTLALLGRPYLQACFRSGEEGVCWHPLSSWLQAGAGRTFAMMLIGPRWNCAGVLAMTDSFVVRRRISIRSDQAAASACFWTVVVYDMRFNTVAHAGHLRASMPDALIELPAGRYFLAIRYYHQYRPCLFPEVVIDDDRMIASAEAGCEQENYQSWLAGLAARSGNLLYCCMHYHAWAFLYLEKWFSGSWVNRLYLPVGNPATGFTYGILKKGAAMVPSRPVGPNETVYLVLYNRASVPVYWTRLTNDFLWPSNISGEGTWLLRRITDDPPEPIYLCADILGHGE